MYVCIRKHIYIYIYIKAVVIVYIVTENNVGYIIMTLGTIFGFFLIWHQAMKNISIQGLDKPATGLMHGMLIASPPGQNGHHFTDDIFRCIFVNKKFCCWIKIWLKLVPKCQIDNNPALVQIMAWRRIGNTPLSEPMPTWFSDAYMRH